VFFLCKNSCTHGLGVTWLGSDAAGQGALDKTSYLMRCQTKWDLDNSTALPGSFASTRQETEEGLNYTAYLSRSPASRLMQLRAKVSQAAHGRPYGLDTWI
jgi:hypothetical protein